MIVIDIAYWKLYKSDNSETVTFLFVEKSELKSRM